MALIEGVGDEVVQFVGAVVLVVVGMLAWRSTNARPDRYRTVLLMRSQRHHTHHPVTVSIRTRALSNIPEGEEPAVFVSGPNMMVANSQEHSTAEPVSDSSGRSGDAESGREARVIPLQEMDSIVDADMAMLDNNRLHFYRRVDTPVSPQNSSEPTSEENEVQEEPQPASTAQMREMDSIVSAMEADVTSSCACHTTEPNTNKPSIEERDGASSSNVNSEETTTTDGQGDQGPNGDARKILIKLKYLNDTLKEVEGSLDELLKDFKWRHFSSELARSHRVVLIFNGRVLPEHATLRALGLHHRAVVHALVHPSTEHQAHANANTEEAHANATHEVITEGPGAERQWDLENILMTLVSVALTIVWFFRCEYSNMFTASASVALFGLTVFYSVAIFGLYLSDTFHFDRRNPAPAPAPAAAPAN